MSECLILASASFLAHSLPREDCLSLFSITKEIHKNCFYKFAFEEWFMNETIEQTRNFVKIDPKKKIGVVPAYEICKNENYIKFSFVRNVADIDINIKFKGEHNNKIFFLQNLRGVKLIIGSEQLIISYDALTLCMFSKFEESREKLVIHFNPGHDCIIKKPEYHDINLILEINNTDIIDNVSVCYGIYGYPRNNIETNTLKFDTEIPFVLPVPIKISEDRYYSNGNNWTTLLSSTVPAIYNIKSVIMVVDDDEYDDLEQLGIFYLPFLERKRTPSSYHEFSLSPNMKLSVLDEISHNLDPNKTKFKNHFWNLKIDRNVLSHLRKTCLVIEFPDLCAEINYWFLHERGLMNNMSCHPRLHFKLIGKNPLKKKPDFYTVNRNYLRYSEGLAGQAYSFF